MLTLVFSGGFGHKIVFDAFSHSRHHFSLVCHSSTQSVSLYDVFKELCFSLLIACLIYLGSYPDFFHVKGIYIQSQYRRSTLNEIAATAGLAETTETETNRARDRGSRFGLGLGTSLTVKSLPCELLTSDQCTK